MLPEPHFQKTTITEIFIGEDLERVYSNESETEYVLRSCSGLGDLRPDRWFLFHQYSCPSAQAYKQLILMLETSRILKQSNEAANYILGVFKYLPIKFTNSECHSSHLVQVLYHYGTHTLKQQQMSRKLQGTPFQEFQIWSILGSWILALRTLKKWGIKNCPASLEGVMVTSDGSIKMLPSNVNTGHEPSHRNGQNVVQMIARGVYLAPEELSGVENQSLEQRFGSSVFTVGMNVLSLCTQQEVEMCYSANFAVRNPQECVQIDPSRVEELFQQLRCQYSEELSEFVFGMLSYYQQERSSIEDLAQAIEQMMDQKSTQESEGLQSTPPNQQMPPMQKEAEDQFSCPAFPCSKDLQTHEDFEDQAPSADETLNRYISTSSVKAFEREDGSSKGSESKCTSIDGQVPADSSSKQNLCPNDRQKHFLERQEKEAICDSVEMKSYTEHYSKEKEGLYTDPVLLQMIREDMNKIIGKRNRKKLGPSAKPNPHSQNTLRTFTQVGQKCPQISFNQPTPSTSLIR